MTVIRTGPFQVNSLIVPLVRNFVFIVDPACCDFSGDSTKVTDFLSSNNLLPVAIILTHGHFDHVSGLQSLKKSFPDIPVLIHKEDSALIGENSQKLQGNHLHSMGFSEFLPYVSNLPEATHFLDDEKTLFDVLNDDFSDSEISSALKKWLIMHTPGHTEGSCCLYNADDKILISGDTLFYRSWGRTDLFGGSEAKIRKSLKRLYDEIDEDALVYPGHDRTGFKMEENY